MKTNQTFGLFGHSRRQLRKIKCAAMIALLDRVGHTLEGRGRMIELARDFNFQFRMSHHRIIVDRDPAIRGDELAVFGQNKRIDFQRSGLDATGGGK